MRMRLLFLTLALAACNPSVPASGAPDGGSVVVPPDADAAPPPVAPPPTAMETVSAAGRVTQGDYTLDVQLGGFTRGSATAGDQTLDTAPVLH